mmetsp:Transcript_12147/g.37024  ORF Transcript_12147/g.37024 Transcript_12147/m.37024 type:complete len:237 (-) Transcript_12147:1267-1977(-)
MTNSTLLTSPDKSLPDPCRSFSFSPKSSRMLLLSRSQGAGPCRFNCELIFVTCSTDDIFDTVGAVPFAISMAVSFCCLPTKSTSASLFSSPNTLFVLWFSSMLYPRWLRSFCRAFVSNCNLSNCSALSSGFLIVSLYRYSFTESRVRSASSSLSFSETISLCSTAELIEIFDPAAPVKDAIRLPNPNATPDGRLNHLGARFISTAVAGADELNADANSLGFILNESATESSVSLGM